jgi:dehydrogenase/reductase SDR family protein 4
VEEALGTFEQLEKNDDIHGVVCHVAKQEDRQNLIDETIKKFGSIDILVSNAGTNPVFGPMLDVSFGLM